jgi:hypothetical protein
MRKENHLPQKRSRRKTKSKKKKVIKKNAFG